MTSEDLYSIQMACVEQKQCLEVVFTSDVEEAWQEVVPESAHIVPQTSVDLQWFSVESNMFLLTDSEQRPTPSAVHQPILVHIGIADRQEDEGEVKQTQNSQSMSVLANT